MDFVTMAAHELRTPLTAVAGYLRLIDSNHSLSEEDNTYIQRALSSTTNLEGLINNLLSLSRIERGRLKLHFSKCDLNQIIENEVKNQNLTAKDKQLQISYKPDSEPIWLWGDAMSIQEVLGNLLSNAIHYTKAGGKITVATVKSKSAVTVNVTDTGIGIAQSAQSRLFTKYYRVSSGLSADSAGTGIGLFVCKTIVEAHKGTVAVKSKPGVGSTFSFSLPLFDPAKYPEAAKAASINSRSKVGWLTKSPTG
jgi:two-component system phosphate regulon sensor histidine kinase PhoR